MLHQAQPRIMALEHAIRAGNYRRAMELLFGPLTGRHTLAEWLLAFGHHSRELPHRLADVTDGAACGDCLILRATMSRRIGALDDAERDLTSAIEILRLLPSARSMLAGAYMNRGNAFRQMPRYEKALRDYSSALELLLSVPNSSGELALLLLNRASLLHALGYCTQALRDADKAIVIFEGFGDRASPDDLPSSLVMRGSIKADMERMTDADLDYQRAAALWRERIAAGEVEWETLLVRQRIIRSLCLSETRQTDEALAELNQAICFLEARIRLGHEELDVLSVACLNLTEVCRSAGLLAEASAPARRSVELYRMLFASGRTDLEGYLAHALLQAARVDAEAADWDSCHINLDEGIAVARKVLAQGQTDLMIPFLAQVGSLVWLLLPNDLDRATALTAEVLDSAVAGLKALPGSEVICRSIVRFLTRLEQAGNSARLSADASKVAWLRQNAVV
jgi:tetratricopeptide (TPR) repeat protein